MRISTRSATALAAAVLVSLTACGGGDGATGDGGTGTTSSPTRDTPSEETPTALPGDLFLTDADALSDALADVAEAVGTDDVQLLAATVRGNELVVQAADPDKRAQVNQWTWRDGAVETAVPVRLVGDGNLRTNLFPSSAVRPAILVKAVAGAPRKADLPKGEVTEVTYGRGLPESTKVQFRVRVAAGGRKATVTYSARGKVLAVG